MAPIATLNADHEVVAKFLPTIHLDILRNGNAAESKKLLRAYQTEGFSYLDLTSDAELCKQWEDLLLVMKQYFTQPIEISRREFLQGTVDLTTSISSQSNLFFSFIQSAHAITLLILKQLSLQLGLSGSSSFESYHADPGPSFSTLGLLRYPKHDNKSFQTSVSHNKHSDVGSLTFLLTQQWGLQFLSHHTNKWELLEPRSGHAIINVGDSLRFQAQGKLASVVHHVIPLQRRQDEDRYSIAYFLRLNDDVAFNDSTGKTWTAREWHDFKFNVFKSPITLDIKGQILTGMREQNDRMVRN
ncbi:hypothetical protein N7540_006802 [Penicillium herquei]|nr:hypothetical protein N7540_006802 [Penicillium herquei]